jgi:hypothetical protein
MLNKNEMRKLIDIVKQQSLNAPLAQTLDDMNMLTSAVNDLSDRLSIRVRKTTQPKVNQVKEKGNVKSHPKSKASTSIPLLPIPKPSLPSKRKSLPSNNPQSLPAKQGSLNPIKPESPI